MHRIRLRSLWTRSTVGSDSADSVALPDADPPVVSEVVYSRRFNRPTGLSPASRVRLRVECPVGHLVAVRLNDRPISSDAVGRITEPSIRCGGDTAGTRESWVSKNVTDDLEPMNEIVIRLSSTDSEPSPHLGGVVFLEIGPSE